MTGARLADQNCRRLAIDLRFNHAEAARALGRFDVADQLVVAAKALQAAAQLLATDLTSTDHRAEERT